MTHDSPRAASPLSGPGRRPYPASTVLAFLLSLAVTAVASSCTRLEPPAADVRLLCDDDGKCPKGLFCLRDDARDRSVCVQPTDDCVGPTPPGSFATNGTPCGDGSSICIDAECVPGECGDGFTSGTETCDGTADCRADCTRCGDGVLDTGESCDNGGNNSDVAAGACRTTCVPAACGDGVRDPGEGCDDGAENSDADPDACRTKCARASCGDGVIDDRDECDDGPANGDAPNACRATCVVASCGDGVIDEDEECDNGGNNSDVARGACRTNCVLAFCGDGVPDPGEDCDEGPGREESTTCRATCRVPRCGDGIVDRFEGDVFILPINGPRNEECDDGEQNDDDLANACRTNCKKAGCGDGVVDDGEGCDNGGNNSDLVAGACRTQCVPAFCGDNIIDPGEECDDGVDAETVNVGDGGEACGSPGKSSPSGLDLSCRRARCGDGIRDSGEECDDENTVSGDGCRFDCGKIEVCGDGIVDENETCDDGNENRRDGCDLCRVQRWQSALVVSGAVEPRDALQTTLSSPADVAVDPLGRVFIADSDNHVIRRLQATPNGDFTVTTIAGDGVAGFAGDGGPAANASLNGPSGVAVDRFGRVVIADTLNHRIRRIELDGSIGTIAGSGPVGGGSGGSSDDRIPATRAKLNEPTDVFINAQGEILIADTKNHRIRRISLDGMIDTVAGNGTPDFFGDGGRADLASLKAPSDIAIDAEGRLLIADTDNHRIRRVTTDNVISTVAGTGAAGFAGDGGPALDAQLLHPQGIAIAADGAVFISVCCGEISTSHEGIRRFVPGGTIATVAGTSPPGFSGDNGQGVLARLSKPRGLAVDSTGGVLVADSGNRRVRRLNTSGLIQTVAGTGLRRPTNDGSAATSTALALPGAVRVDPDGNVFVADLGNHRIRRIEPDGTVRNLVGTGVAATSDDSVSRDEADATKLALTAPAGLALFKEGLYFSEFGSHVVRRLDTGGQVTTIAGIHGETGSSGDGGPATGAFLNAPKGIAIDFEERLLIADSGNHAIRRIGADGSIQTIAGKSGGGATAAGFAGDGGPANNAALSSPEGVAVDAEGCVLIADTQNHRIRRVDLAGEIRTIAGNGSAGFSGDGGPAVDASLQGPVDVAVDQEGRVLIADRENHRIRRIEANGTINTIAGNGTVSSSGDGGPATRAGLALPSAVAVDALGRVLIAEANHVRRFDGDPQGTITTIVGPLHPLGPGRAHQARLYASEGLVVMPDAAVISVGGFDRALRINVASESVAPTVEVVVGVGGTPDRNARALARFADLLGNPRGVAFDPLDPALVITETTTLCSSTSGAPCPGRLRRIDVDPDDDGNLDDPSAWTSAVVNVVGLDNPAGIAHDLESDSFMIADADAHCIRRVTLTRQAPDSATAEDVFGQCGVAGAFPGFLNQPTHALVSPTSGALYIADTGNHRVLRVDFPDAVTVVLGDGSVSSAGEGSPARLFPVNAPRQLAFDDFGNLYVASTTTVRLVANGDGDVDADGDDRVSTIFGGGARSTFPESDAFCLRALTVDHQTNRVFVADACQGFVVELVPTFR
jgi:cysteine-rich repeat protein